MLRLSSLLALWLLSACGNPNLAAGRRALAEGDYLRATRHFEVAQTELPGDPAPGLGLADAQRAFAMHVVTEGRCEEAREALKWAEGYTAPVLADHQALFECTAQRGAPAETQIAGLRALVALGDQRARVLGQLMRLELAVGDVQHALDRVEPLERRFALTHDDRVKLSGVLVELKRDQEALRFLLRVVQADPTNPLHRLKVAELRERLGEHEPARQTYRALTMDFPDNPVVFLRMADFLQRAGDPGGARAMMHRADQLRRIRREERPLRSLPTSRR